MTKAFVKLRDLESEYTNPIAELVQNCCRFDSEIHILQNGKKYNAKSIFSIMRMKLEEGSICEITVSGNDEEYAFMKTLNFLAEKTSMELGGVI